MDRITVIIDHELNDDKILFVSKNKKLKKNSTIIFGNTSVLVKSIQNIKCKDNKVTIILPIKIAKLLKIPINSLRLKYIIDESKQSLYLVHVIGIFIRKNKKQKKLTFIQKEIIKHYILNAKELNYFAFAFMAEDINFNIKTIQGYILDDNQQVVKKPCPFPNVIYDQNFSRAYENQNNVIDAIQKLYSDVPCYFNHGYLNKWEIYEYISSHDKAKEYHPPSKLLDNINIITKELKKYSLVYLKPVNGSQGKGIITINLKNKIYEYKYQGETLIGGKCLTEKKLHEIISNIIKKRKYIVQKGLKLIKYNDCPVDIRVLMQKDSNGAWIRTKMFARVSKPGAITSNLSRGGEAKTIDEVLNKVFTDKMIISIKKKLRIVSKTIAIALEEQSQKTFGELGLDIGITEDGQIWLIEVNSKPWKTIETKSGTKALVDTSFRRPMEYAGYLANNCNKNEV